MGHGTLRFKDDKHRSSSSKSKSSTSRHHKRRKRSRSYSPLPEPSASSGRQFTPEAETLDEPITPPRNGFKRTHYTLEREYDFGSDLPPEAASKNNYDNDAEFQERLFDVMQEDEPAFDNVYYIPDRWRTTAATSTNSHGATITSVQLPEGHNVNGLSEEQYAEYMRNGMWRKSHADALKAAQERDKQRAEREKEARHRREQQRKEEAERIRKLAQAKSAQAREKVEQQREAYGTKWSNLQQTKADEILGYNDFPWPVQASSGRVTKGSVSDFLFGGIDEDNGGEDGKKLRKQALRAAVLAYHPDRFDRFVSKVPEAHGQRQSVKEMGLLVSQLLNELLGEL